jgi:NAD(P)H-dependent FMN reductase
MRHLIAGPDAVLFATPEHNASVPGALKNALDWISRPIVTNVVRDNPSPSSAPRPGPSARGQAELRKILRSIGAKVVDRELALAHADQQFDDRGSLLAVDLREQPSSSWTPPAAVTRVFGYGLAREPRVHTQRSINSGFAACAGP